MNFLEIFFLYIFPILVFVFGCVGNTLSLIVLSRKNMDKIGPKKMYIYLFTTDSVNMFLLLVNYFQYGFQYDLTVVSKYTCKLYWYINYSFGAMSPMLLVYISFEKVISIKFPAKIFKLRNQENQFVFFLIVIAFNAVCYIPILFSFKIQEIVSKNQTVLICDFIDDERRLILNHFDSTNRVYMPFVLIMLCSLFLTNSILHLRRRISESVRPNNSKSLRKDIKLLISLLVLNAAYIILSLPSSIAVLFSFSNLTFVISLYVLYNVYGVNFYIILMNNSLFRKEFKSIIKF